MANESDPAGSVSLIKHDNVPTFPRRWRYDSLALYLFIILVVRDMRKGTLVGGGCACRCCKVAPNATARCAPFARQRYLCTLLMSRAVNMLGPMRPHGLLRSLGLRATCQAT
jgi:hypothetical protein